MSHEDLIATLAFHATPVRPLPAPLVRLARWVLCALVAVGIAIAWRGLRANWAAAFSDPTFVATTLIIVIVAGLSAWTALMLAVPGALRSPTAKRLPIAGLGVWGAILILQAAGTGNLASALLTEPLMVACLWKTYGIAVGPALALILLARRAAPLDWRWTAGLAAVSALAFGVLGTELICPITAHAHLVNWHFLPVVLMTGVAFLGGFVAQMAPTGRTA